MTPEDYSQLARVAEHCNGLDRIGLLSPVRGGERRLFPRATSLPRWRWDLDRPGRGRYDLLVAANVFLCSPDPERWLRHVLACCRYFLLLDVVRRRRSPGGELGPDGDRVRYGVGALRPRIPQSFDLASLGDRLLAHTTYFGGANRFDDAPLHLLALLRGDLAQPILRLDDYPTGVRPILGDLTPLHEILERVDARGLSYHLGIVPALLDDDRSRFLRRLRHMIPAAHGFDHGYPRHAPRLLAAGDPMNRGTLGTFNEFAGRSAAQIRTALLEGRDRLENALGRPVEGYIPPCNRGDRKTGRSLPGAGYRYYLSDRRIPGCPLPWHRSDFSGRSTEFDPASRPDVIGLHVTWEWDAARGGDAAALDRLLDSVAERARAARRQAAALARIVRPDG